MKTITVNVKRAQAYASLLDAGSYNYKYEPTPPAIQHEEQAWNITRCQAHSARGEFFKFIKTGQKPNFAQEIYWVNQWLAEHGHKGGDWASTVAQYQRDLAFLQGGYAEFADKVEPVQVVYHVETLPAYALGTFDKQIGAKLMPFNRANSFTYTEEGFFIHEKN
jgi:hypothetical protein